MKAKSEVTLVATVHQPDERLASLAATQLPALAARYAALTAFCSSSTHPSMLDLLRDHGVSVRVDDKPSAGMDGIGHVRRKALRAALEAGTPHLQMCDFDRALHWVAHYPHELDAVLAEIGEYDLLVLGRTERAWATHPPYQAETEPLFNQVFALTTGLPWDVGAGSRGFSRRGAERLLDLSQEPTIGIDAEWPLLLLGQEGYSVGFRACDGLEFETADRFAAEIEAAGGYAVWEAKMSADPARWVFRMRLALLIAEAIVRYGGVGQMR
ncbi:MAG: hypothetical protein ACK2UA_11550 [Anaerolineae bacterium]|jgi:hypothetical protein